MFEKGKSHATGKPAQVRYEYCAKQAEENISCFLVIMKDKQKCPLSRKERRVHRSC